MGKIRLERGTLIMSNFKKQDILYNYPEYPKLFKYMSKFFLEKTQKTKKFYLNFLESYRDIELKGLQIDASEGHLEHQVHIGKHTINDGKNPAFDNVIKSTGLFKFDSNEKGFSLENISLVNNIKNNNFYVFCCSHKENDSLNTDHGDGKLVIKNPKMFIHFLNMDLRKKGIAFYGGNPCIYVENKILIHKETDNFYNFYDPVFYKTKEYSAQNEFRFLWKPKDNILIKNAIEIYSPKAWEHCEFVYKK